MKYRKKSAEVDASRVDSVTPTPDWLVAAKDRGDFWVTSEDDIRIRTPGGPTNVSVGDWIVQDENGALSSMTDAEFQANYIAA